VIQAIDPEPAPAPAFNLQPTLVGAQLTLRPLHSDDLEPLYAIARDPMMWAMHPEQDRWQRPVFEQLFATCLRLGGALAVVHNATGRLIGSSSFYEYKPDQSEVVIGYTYLACDQWGGAANREIKTLMLQHAYRHVQQVWFHVGTHNLRSRRAMEKIGAQLSHSIVVPNADGVSRDMVVYSMRPPQLP
jgi:RimJ/RimL family protein N-acetyltransferase